VGLAGEWERGFQAALAVLVVACPCALGIATPMATTIALSLAIGRGCLVRSARSWRRCRGSCDGIRQKPAPSRWAERSVDYAPAAQPPYRESLRLAAGVEQEVSHPYARAVVAAVLAQASRYRRRTTCA